MEEMLYSLQSKMHMLKQSTQETIQNHRLDTLLKQTAKHDLVLEMMSDCTDQLETRKSILFIDGEDHNVSATSSLNYSKSNYQNI